MTNFAPDRPYNDLPLLPPPGEIETKVVLKACIEARAALAELKQCGGLIPNQAMLINTIPVLEAQASSAIENIVTTADRLFQFASTPEAQMDAATKEALRYSRALFSGFQSIQRRSLTTRTAMEVCSTIKGVEMEIRRTPGTALIEASSGQVIYTPPETEAVLQEKLTNWEKFIHEATEFDPLVRLAVMHYQFEAIHPFTDGNGRTGRILNILFLIDRGLLEIPVLYLSRYIIENKQDYYQYLHQVTAQGDWQSWILFVLNAVFETAKWTTQKIKSIRLLMEITTDYVKKTRPKVYNRDLLDLIFIQPYCRIANVVDAEIAHRQTAANYLKQLCEIGVLQETKVGREKLFIHPRFLQLLTAENHTVYPYADFATGGAIETYFDS
ncbi:MAG: Fic family protein [Microcoleus sp.]|uniref:protein adenylyltransferase Fic n=1 Tax=Microcoleus sp. TaxID=44472 RepID=UPI003C755518